MELKNLEEIFQQKIDNEIKIEPKGIKDKGKEFWKDYDSDPLYGIFVVEK